jgi:hypothetical protein
MGTKRRNTRRNRREPLRRAIPATVPRGNATPGPARSLASVVPVHDTDRFLAGLAAMPAELVPIYSPLVIVHNTMAGSPANRCVTTCYQLSRTYQWLGFEAEMWAACATVLRKDGNRTKFADIGVWDRPPTIGPDQTTNGHVVVWAESFNRMIDPTIVQEPALLRAARDDETFTLPVVIPAANRQQMLASKTTAVPRGRFLISYMFFPEWSDAFDVVRDGEIGEVLEYASLDLAHKSADLLRAVAEHRQLGSELGTLYPELRDLLSGRRRLPPLPPEPTALARYRIRP